VSSRDEANTRLSRDEDQSPLTGVLPKRLIFKTLFHQAIQVGQWF